MINKITSKRKYKNTEPKRYISVYSALVYIQLPSASIYQAIIGITNRIYISRVSNMK